MNILQEICLHQQELVDTLKIEVPVSTLKSSPYYQREVNSLKAKFESTEDSGIIAEFKRRSPSKPEINLDAVAAEIVPGYEKAGAFAVSILTNAKYFGGSNEDITSIRDLCSLPLLRKDFIVDEYQVYETKAIGADIILLIAAAMPKERLEVLAKLAKEIGLEILLELKSLSELKHINRYIDFIGVNNRDLSTFKVDIRASEVLSFAIPTKMIRISESGLSQTETVKRLEDYGYRGFLMGEHFMIQEDPALACATFVNSIKG